MDNNIDEIVKIKNMTRLNDRLKLRIKHPSTMSERRRREEARLQAMVGDNPSQVVETCRNVGEGSRVSSSPIGAREVDPEEYQRRFSPLNLYSVDIEENSGDLEDDGENEAGQFVDVLATCPSVVVGRTTAGKFQRYSNSSSSSVAEGKKRRHKDMSWLLEDEAPGGPLNPELLRSFKSHVAYALWVDPSKDRGVLRGYARETALSRLSGWTLSEKAQSFVDDSGLGHLTGCMMSQLDMPLLSAFLERWQPDTNTFHMPFGEMTIMLHDVRFILRIPVCGRACKNNEADIRKHIASACEFLDMSEKEVDKPYCAKKAAPYYLGGGILQDTVRDRAKGSKSDTLQAQGYLMLLLGSALFVDKTSDRVRVNMFPLLRDMSLLNEYAWGAATLAFLYRQLGIASRADGRQVAGCLTLLQAWIYEYFPCLRPHSSHVIDVAVTDPRALCWRPVRVKGTVDELCRRRRMLDGLTAHDVTWLPYCSSPHLIEPMTLFSGFLRFLDIVEPYQPDRVVRQLGYTQTIPRSMPVPDVHYRPTKPISYNVQYASSSDHNWNSPEDHCIVIGRYQRAIPSSSVEDGYLEWYCVRTHPVIINPATLPEEENHVDGGMTDTQAIHRVAELYSAIYYAPPNERVVHLQKFYDDARPILMPYIGRGRGIIPSRGGRGSGRG